MDNVSSELEELREELRQTRQKIEALENWFEQIEEKKLKKQLIQENIEKHLWDYQAKEESIAGLAGEDES